MPELSVHFEVFCDECSAELTTSVRKGNVYADPCGKCIAEARKDGFHDGHTEGYQEGYDAGVDGRNP